MFGFYSLTKTTTVGLVEGGVTLSKEGVPDLRFYEQKTPRAQPTRPKPPRIHLPLEPFASLKAQGFDVVWCFTDGISDGDYDDFPNDRHIETIAEAEEWANQSWTPEMPCLKVRF